MTMNSRPTKAGPATYRTAANELRALQACRQLEDWGIREATPAYDPAEGGYTGQVAARRAALRPQPRRRRPMENHPRTTPGQTEARTRQRPAFTVFQSVVTLNRRQRAAHPAAARLSHATPMSTSPQRPPASLADHRYRPGAG